MIQNLLNTITTSERFADWFYGFLAGVIIWIVGYLGSDLRTHTVHVPLWLRKISCARYDRYHRVDIIGLATQLGGVLLIVCSFSAFFTSSHKHFIHIYAAGLIVTLGIMVIIKWKYYNKR